VTAPPRVDILMAHENMDGVLIDAAVAAGARRIGIAGTGNGNMERLRRMWVRHSFQRWRPWSFPPGAGAALAKETG